MKRKKKKFKYCLNLPPMEILRISAPHTHFVLRLWNGWTFSKAVSLFRFYGVDIVIKPKTVCTDIFFFFWLAQSDDLIEETINSQRIFRTLIVFTLAVSLLAFNQIKQNASQFEKRLEKEGYEYKSLTLKPMKLIKIELRREKYTENFAIMVRNSNSSPNRRSILY